MLRLIRIIAFVLLLGFVITITGCHSSKGVVKREPDSKLTVQKQPESKASAQKQADSKGTAPKKSDSKASTHNKQNSEVIVQEPLAYEKIRKDPPAWVPSPNEKNRYLYYYYPDLYIYFDVVRGLYFVCQDDKWQVELRPPKKIDSSTEYVLLEMSTDMPYQFHSDVIKWFPPGYSKSLPRKK